MLFLFSIIAGSFVLVFIIDWIISVRRFNRKVQIFEGPKPLPFIGNALDFPSTKHVLPAFMRYQKCFNGVAKVAVGLRTPTLVMSNYEFLEFVLSSNKIITKTEEYEWLSRWLGTGLLTSAGEFNFFFFKIIIFLKLNTKISEFL